MPRVAAELTKQVAKPIRKEALTPNLVQLHGVTNTLAISPSSGKMKTTPAYLPIQEEAILPWIIYRISAPTPQQILPTISNSQYQGRSQPPKIAQRSCPSARAMAPVQRRQLEMRWQKKPMGMMKRMEMALGMEQRRLNWVMFILWICQRGFCIV